MVDYEKKELFQGEIDKQLVISSDDESIKITNNILHSQNFELKESLCSQDQLVFASLVILRCILVEIVEIE